MAQDDKPFIPVGKRPRVILDIETTGLIPGPDAAEIIEFAGLRIEPDGSTYQYKVKIKPEHIETAHPKALEINGYTPEAWVGALEKLQALLDIVRFIEGCVVIGQNPKFDLEFIKAECRLLDIDTSDVPYHVVDTATLIWEHLVPLGISNLSLKSACRFLGISNKGAHTALADIRRTQKVYDQLNSAGPLRKLRWRLRALKWKLLRKEMR